ncbi:DUF402 domain-containing protein [Ktedonospora formicarum]|uniref:DUF402 domain-containing protein n=1 Tax=Ktedonospora formicarum TaxID=2778364 RepID=A0A8J3HY73_9CHLR|nr:DUF402 domain-containing protein [Ktedonospora formicarum]GHO43163.1 hypothetical protein KSX_13260 [Ktedonospora formicarum]
MITIIKQSPQRRETIRYQGEVVEQLPNGLLIQAYWTLPTRDLGYVCFEKGDSFLEYYYIDRWFNIFAIAHPDGKPKGWYCNIAEPAYISDTSIEQVDLLLDVWININGKHIILDEDEFAQATNLSEQQRQGAQEGLEALLHLLHTQQAPFTTLSDFGA